jgi:DNA modification methylase
LSALLTIHGNKYELDARQSNRPLTDAERRELVVSLHAGAVGSWDWDRVSGWDAAELQGWGMDKDLLKLWNNDANNLKELLKSEAPTADAEPAVDRAAELLEKWGVQPGDLWQIGDHRLICGDCTDAATVARVMGGEKGDLLFTSPPYAAQREYEIGDFDWLGLMLGMSEQAIENMKDNGSILVNLGLVHVDGRVDRYWDEWLDWMEDNGQPLYGWYVWDKLSGLMGDWKGRLAPAHEWIFHFAKQPKKANKTAPTKYAENGVTHYKKDKVGLRGKDGTMNGFTFAGREVNQTKVIDSVIRCQPQRGGVEGHPAPFSVPFAQALIEVYANPGEIVYEPFCGSGTTLLACENLGRIGRACELSPAYVAVALERMSTAFPHLDIRRLDAAG